jgi:ATP synthase protein I
MASVQPIPLIKNTKRLKQKNDTNAYLKYSGLAFQMLAVMAFGVWSGMKLDSYFNLKFPVFLVILSLTSIIASLLVVIKNLPKD